MKVSMKKLDGNQVRLECVATPEEVNNALHAGQLGFAQSMGLRPEQGKTIAQVAEEKMGIKNLDSIVEAGAIQGLVPFALDKKNLIPSFPPQPEPKSALKRDREFAFDVVVALKPDYELKSYDPVEIRVPAFALNPEIVDQQLKEMAERYTTYVTADAKPVEKGDSCLIAMKCLKDGEEVAGLTTDGRTYTAGEGYMPDGFDREIIGMQPGETKTFTFEGPGLDEDFNEITEVIDCTVTVKEIQKPTLPEIDDEWVAANMPMYKSAADLRADIQRNVERGAREQYENYKRQLAVTELARRFEGKIADEVYEAMRANLMENMRMELQQSGQSWEDFVAQNGGEQQFGMMLMLQTREMLVQGFALDSVFRHEKLTLTDEDIEAACRAMNPQANPKQLRQQFEQSGRGFALRESAERLKANNWVLEHAVITEFDPTEQAAPAEEAPAE
ncbi:MAG: trigger factor [Eggerthellaceae bacterium]|jgi:trigger factor|nr:trigger factor [Eggerthellaceae bacterium]